MNDKKLIHASVYDPSRAVKIFGGSTKKDKASCSRSHCSNSENCELYKKGECALLTVTYLESRWCPYGKETTEIGFTQRAGAYYSWISKRKKENEGCLNKLKCYTKRIAVIGDYIFLPYAHMDMNEDVFKKGCFLPKVDFNIDNIISICKFVPQALFGGAISSYQTEIVPKFIKHLSEAMPKVFKDLADHYPRASQILKDHSDVGRKAHLNTLCHNSKPIVDIHSGAWTWDGTYLTSHNSHISYGLVRNFSEVRVKPDDDCIVKITHDSQVDNNTKFTD